MGKFASQTKVSAHRSIEEIEKLLLRYNSDVDKFMSGRSKQDNTAFVAFEIDNISYKIELPLPDRNEYSNDKSFDQEYRRRWRAVVLVVKAKLEAVESEISTFQQEFMTNIMISGNKTVRDLLAPQLEKCIKNGKMPQLLLTAGEG